MSSRGFTLLEVLVTLIVLAIGMLGLANLQSKIHVTEVESYQRAHAVLLVQDMVDRINANRLNAKDYVKPGILGTDTVENCAAPADLAARDRCQWSEALLGASEKRADNSSAGGMIGARGCIEQRQAPNPAVGVCTPGIYRITVAWQGLHRTKQPALTCGKDLYGGAANDDMRRAIATEISVGLPRCASS